VDFGSPLTDPRMMLAQQLMQSSGDASPVRSWTQELARALNPAIGAYMFNKGQGEYNDTMAKALQASKSPGWVSPDTFQGNNGQTIKAGTIAPGTGGEDAMMGVLQSNPMTRGLATQMQMQQIQQKQALAAELAKEEGKYKLQGQYEPGIKGATASAEAGARQPFEFASQTHQGQISRANSSASNREAADLALRNLQQEPRQVGAGSTLYDPTKKEAIYTAPVNLSRTPEGMAFESFMAEHPDATPEQQQAFIQRSKGMRSPATAAMQQFMAEHPEATSDDISAFNAKLKSQGSSTQAFATGKQGQAVNSMNVATEHLGLLRDLSKALDNGDIRAFNSIGQTYSQQTGSPAPTNFDTAKQIVGDELIKAVIGSGAGVADRENIQTAFNKASSPQQLQGAIDNAFKLMGGQLKGLKLQYEQTTGKKDFEDHLTPAARAAMEPVTPEGGGAELPAAARSQLQIGHNTTFGNGQIWTLDAQGNPKQVK